MITLICVIFEISRENELSSTSCLHRKLVKRSELILFQSLHSEFENRKLVSKLNYVNATFSAERKRKLKCILHFQAAVFTRGNILFSLFVLLNSFQGNSIDFYSLTPRLLLFYTLCLSPPNTHTFFSCVQTKINNFFASFLSHIYTLRDYFI